MGKKLYNSQEWEVKCLYTNIKNDVYNEIDTDCINYIKIINSLETYVPTVVIRFIDKGYALLNNLNTNGTYVRLLMVEPKQTYNEEEITLDCSLIVNDIKIISINQQFATFEIYCTYVTDIELSKNIMYSNNKEQGKISPYTIIEDVVSQLNCEFDYNYVDTSQRIDFITSQNMTVKHIIDYCLEMGVSKKDPPTYFLTRILDNTCMLFNQYSTNDYILDICNDNLVFLTEGNGETNNDLGRYVDKLIGNMPNGGINNMKLLSTYKFNEFDHNKRKWSQIIYNGKMISSLLNNINNNSGVITEITAPVNLQDYDHLVKSYPNFSQHNMYYTFRDLEVGTKNIQFFIFGNLSREAGQTIILKTQKEQLRPELNGIWTIYSCVHKWEDTMYTNDITCYRTITQKPIVNA